MGLFRKDINWLKEGPYFLYLIVVFCWSIRLILNAIGDFASTTEMVAYWIVLIGGKIVFDIIRKRKYLNPPKK